MLEKLPCIGHLNKPSSCIGKHPLLVDHFIIHLIHCNLKIRYDCIEICPDIKKGWIDISNAYPTVPI